MLTTDEFLAFAETASLILVHRDLL
jgi:hypothetical protein